jgi:hypothetical protein
VEYIPPPVGENPRPPRPPFDFSTPHPPVFHNRLLPLSSLTITLQLRVYTAKKIMEELERAKLEFLQATMVVRESKKVFLPRLVERYAREACLGPDDVLPWAHREGGVADGRKQDAAQRPSWSRRKAAQAVEWLPYSVRFRYAFARSMVDKPQC